MSGKPAGSGPACVLRGPVGMPSRIVAVVVAATLATACLSPEKCGYFPEDGWGECEADRFEGAVIGTGLTLGLLAIGGLIGLAVQNAADKAQERRDRAGEYGPVERRAARHAEAGRCEQAIRYYKQARRRDPATGRQLERNPDVAACLAVADTRKRGGTP